MRKYCFITGILAVTLLSGCVLSFYPFFTEKDVALDPQFDGSWKTKPVPAESKEQDNPTTDVEATFTVSHLPQMGTTYVLETDIKGQGKGKFQAQIGVIGTNRFLQLAPSRPDNLHPKTLFGGHFMQGWSLWKLKLEPDKMTLNEMNYLWFDEMLKAKKLDIKHEQVEGGFILLTVPTSDLQDFILKHKDTPGLWGNSLEFIREKP
jgi:hypothetical protein